MGARTDPELQLMLQGSRVVGAIRFVRAPDQFVAEIVEGLKAALEQFAEIEGELRAD